MKKYHRSIIGCLIVIGASFVMHAANAAQLNISTNGGVILQGQTIQVNVALDTQGDDANAIQAEIDFPSTLFKLEKIDDGSSAVSLWIHPPQETTPGVIDLAGIMPGGYSGMGKILSFILQPLTAGSGTIEVATSTVLANDGQGTPLVVTVNNAHVIVEPSNTSSSSLTEPLNDETPPNPFAPEISSDPNIFGGKYFLVFNTTDSQSGIDHYEVLEVPSGESQQAFSSWHIAESPYLLTDQDLSSDIYVRAVDHDGNFIVVKIPARYPEKIGRGSYVYIILILIAMVLLFLWIRRRRAHV